MTDLKDFLATNKEMIHELLNEMWQTIERLAVRLDNKILDIELDISHGNYIEIEDGWSEAFYANPSIAFPFGEIGYSLDGIFCVFSIDPRKISVDNIAQIIHLSRKNPRVYFEMYGGDDVFETYFNSKDEGDIDEILEAIDKTTEEFIQLDLGIEPLAEDEITDAFIELAVQLYNFLSETNLLTALPM
ncbi:MAG: DUF3201 domain-containing protein [Candidatus Heimdallarchaeota archaeon]